MAIRCKAFFGGVEVQVSFSMTRSHGTSPDIGQLVWRQGTTLPSSPNGDLVFKNNDATIITFFDCTLRNPSEQRTPMRNIVFQVIDRRWRWKHPTIFGNWNVRDDKDEIVTGTEKTPRELAELLLTALGETGYDATALPTDVALAPAVNWHYTPAAVELDKLCVFFGCSVTLQNNNTVKIVTDNTGAEPDNTGLMVPTEDGLIINLAPDYVTAYANDTLFDSWLTTEALGVERDGTRRPIDLLSYRPPQGWNVDPTRGYEQGIRNTLRGILDEELIDKTVAVADSTVFRLFRVTGFPPGQLFFPGFTLEASVDAVADLPEEGDPAKVYVLDEKRTVIWDGTQYIGVTYYVGLTDWALVDPLLISSTSVSPIVVQGTKTAMEAERITRGIDRYTLMAPMTTAIDTRILLPLLQTRVVQGVNEIGEFERLEAEVCGRFVELDTKLCNKETTNLKSWKHGLQVDTKKGHVLLGATAWQRSSTGVDPADIYLRCGYGYRQTPYGSRYHRQWNQATGNTLGVANGVLNRTDVNEYRVQVYDADYNDLSDIGTPVTNTTALDAILEQSAIENIKQYQNYVAPKRKVYTPFRAIDTNGIVTQVTYEGGDKRVGQTMASIAGSFDRTQTPAKQKLLMQQQRQQAEADMQTFRSTKAFEMGNIA